jgi:hypothetical protein
VKPLTLSFAAGLVALTLSAGAQAQISLSIGLNNCPYGAVVVPLFGYPSQPYCQAPPVAYFGGGAWGGGRGWGRGWNRGDYHRGGPGRPQGGARGQPGGQHPGGGDHHR